VLRELGSATRMTRYGGDAYFFCALALGQVDIAMDARMQPYDIAPLIPIIAGAGAVLSTWNRGDASDGGDVISASSQPVLDAALKVIDRARSPKARAPRAPKLKVQPEPKPRDEPKEEAREEPKEDVRDEAKEEAKEAG
jgi:Inositol monophosphatase family